MYGTMLTQAKVKFRRQLLNKLLLFANLIQSYLINEKIISYRESSKLKKISLCVCQSKGLWCYCLLRHTSNFTRNY